MTRATMAALLCMGLGGCGAEDAARDVAERVDPVAEAAEKTVAAGGARLEGRMRMQFAGQPVSIPFTVKGAVSFADERSRITMDLADRIRGATGREIRQTRADMDLPYNQIQDGDVLYDSDDRIREKGLAEGIAWIKIDYGELDEQAGTALAELSRTSEVNPQEMLRFLQAAGGARRAGTETIDGVRTTRWRADVRIADYPKTLAANERAKAEKTVRFLEQAWGDEPMPMTVWIDDEGLIRRERFVMTMRQEGEEVRLDARVDLLDIGRPVAIDLPDDDSVQDVTEVVADHIGG